MRVSKDTPSRNVRWRFDINSSRSVARSRLLLLIPWRSYSAVKPDLEIELETDVSFLPRENPGTYQDR